MPKPTAGAPLGLSLLLAMAPKCPLCLAAHGSVLGVLGLGELAGGWTRAAVAASLLALLALLAHRAPRRRGYAPLLLAAAGAALLLAETFHVHPPAEHAHGGGADHGALAAWAGIGLVAAAVWNAWPRRGAPAPAEPCHRQPCS